MISWACNDKKAKDNPNLDPEELYDIPSNANSIFTSLKWDNNPKIIEYLSPRLDVNNDGTPDGPVSLDFLNKKYYDLIDNKK